MCKIPVKTTLNHVMQRPICEATASARKAAQGEFLPKNLWIPTWTKENFQVKTRVVRRTLHPVYDEDFTFYGVHFNQLPVCIIILPPSS